ncbi:DUF6427 family protein [Cytophagaceae bacterium DM2B3-1]|uniref:DUF6427 family protein n=1 Tax=Xanthocytophaga flava TaxID=3048013 RepID=A0ABT7CSM1_9BACT|nr:DUF6427 family protein [Xanthocytophaga flavus]MDJ1496727.1 DUF6427 family protein [Xanthocytophaga flavus]
MLRFLLTGGFSSVFVAWFFLVVIRLPLLIHGLPMIQPELNWLLIGERLHRGFMIYTETWDSLSPLSAGVYALIDILFGRSQTAYHIIAMLLVMLQSAYFSMFLQRHELYTERTHLPALLYCLCATLFYDFYTLSPVLLGLTFLLIGLNALFTQLDRDDVDDEAFGIGFYLSMATLFYIPFGWFIGFAFVALVLLSAVRLRKFLLLLFGFTLPLAILLLSFYLVNEYDAIYFNWIAVFWERYSVIYADFKTFIIILQPLGLLLVLAASQLIGGNTRFINYQIRCQQAMFMWLLAAGVSLFFADDFAPYVFLVFVPPVAFFGTYYFALVRKAWLGELVFWLLLVYIGFNNLGKFYLPASATLWNDTALIVKKNPEHYNFRQKRLLVIGQGLDEYKDNIPSTPYLTWRLSRRHFENLDSYTTVIDLYNNFLQDPPEVIVDKHNIVPTLFKRLPALGQEYSKGTDPNVYFRKTPVKTAKH